MNIKYIFIFLYLKCVTICKRIGKDVMAQEINLVKDGVIRKGVIGFSWTTFFFGFFVPLSRGDLKWVIIMIVLWISTFGIGNFILCFFYNKIYTRELLEKGYQPADDFSKKSLERIELMS